MPFDKTSLVTMTAEEGEFVNKEQIAERFGVTLRTIERLIEANAKTLGKRLQREGRKKKYLWSDVLQCARIHVGIGKKNGPSVSMKREYTKQRVLELEAEIEQLQIVIDVQREEIISLRQLLNANEKKQVRH